MFTHNLNIAVSGFGVRRCLLSGSMQVTFSLRPRNPSTLRNCCQATTPLCESGPSLRRGRKQEEQGKVQRTGEKDENRISETAKKEARSKRYVKGADIDRAGFRRVYDIAALRVPADESHRLAYQLKGHLLNWPRIKNVARVAGDDVEEDMQGLFWDAHTKDGVIYESVRKAVFDEEAAEAEPARAEKMDVISLRRQGKLRFPHLEALSRPRFISNSTSVEDVKSSRSNMVEARGSTRSFWEERAVVVEVLEDVKGRGEEVGGLGNFLSLLEQVSHPRRFQGSTRLLLLDEKLAGKPLHELPMALQVAVSAGNKRLSATREMVQTRLILSYDYWPVVEILRELLPQGMIVPSTFDKLGHIACLHLQQEHYPFRHVIAQVILDRHKPRIRSVVCNMEAARMSDDGQQCELLAGNSKLVTSLIHNGTLFKIDLAKGPWPKIARSRDSMQKSPGQSHFTWRKRYPYPQLPSVT